MRYETYAITDPMYNSAVTLVVNCSIEDFEKFLAKYRHESEKPLEETELPGIEGLCLSLKNKSGAHCYVVWIRKFDWTIPDMARLVHELSHLAMFILDWKQIPIRVENTEVYAYLLDYYVTEAFKKVKVHAPRYKRKKDGVIRNR